MQLSTLVLAALSSLASAQRTWVVSVAQNASLTFSPDRLTVQPGEMVQFQFLAGNHTVTQSTFDKPCQPIAMNSNVTGFHSGFLPVAASAAMGMVPTYTIQINNTNPLWLYCAQGRHCEQGMVMVINEPANNPNRTLENYRSLAAQAQTVLPGGTPGSGGTTGTTNSPTQSGDAATPSQTAAAGMLTAPATLVVLAAAGFAMLL
ncbi:Cupredoxin [Canariomyces notabilis]|uniref:Cupredoxin n=1 Tax=Canariomyces notabilis TaxID=2074819 RepID=A0AAN6QJP0_9PEZI|nr:Cupredoxin [Canariomyces arenarius]